MRCLNRKLCGPEDGKIQVRFNNGVKVVSGFILYQFDWLNYIVSSDGVTNHKVRLAQTSLSAESLNPGFATILADLPNGSKGYIKRLFNRSAYTTEGNLVSWSTSYPRDIQSNRARLETIGVDPVIGIGNPDESEMDALRFVVFGF